MEIFSIQLNLEIIYNNLESRDNIEPWDNLYLREYIEPGDNL